MILLLIVDLLISIHENSPHITFLSKSTVGLQFCMIYQHFLSHFSKQKVFVFSLIFWQHVGEILVKANNAIFDIASVLNTASLSSNVTFLILQKFRTPWIFEIIS